VFGFAGLGTGLRSLDLHLEALVDGGRMFNGHLAGITGVSVDGVYAAHVHTRRLLITGDYRCGTVCVTGPVRAAGAVRAATAAAGTVGTR